MRNLLENQVEFMVIRFISRDLVMSDFIFYCNCGGIFWNFTNYRQMEVFK